MTHFGLGAPGGGKMTPRGAPGHQRAVPRRGPGLTGFHTESYRAARAAAHGGRASRRADRGARRPRQEVGAPPRDRSQVQRAPARAGLPREVRVRGGAELAANRVKTGGLTVSVAGADATARGSVESRAAAPRPGPWAWWPSISDGCCAELGLPPFGKERARRRFKANGSFDDPRVIRRGNGARSQRQGRRTLRELGVAFGLEHGLARLDQPLRAAVRRASIEGTRLAAPLGEAGQQAAQVAGRRR